MISRNKITILILISLLTLAGAEAYSQEKTDSLILNVGKSQIVFLIRDKADLAKLQNYDLNEILDRLSLQLTGDSTLISDGEALSDTTVVVDSEPDDSGNYYKNNDRYKDRDDRWDNDRRYNRDEDRDRRYTSRRRSGRRHVFNIDIGTNNYLEDGEFPGESNQLYAVRPWGSWYVGLASINQNYLGRSFYIEWGPSVSWYNFKFENDAARIIDADVTDFNEAVEPNVDYKKSKLTAAYVNLSVVPMFHFGERRNSSYIGGWKYKDSSISDFRVGVGGYVGYRISSYSKTVVEIDDDKEKNRDKDSFNMTNVRYGIRAQLGFRGTDLFFTYDLNELFNENRGPELNAFTIGVTL